MEKFEKFLKAYLGDQYNHKLINVTTIMSKDEERKLAYHYYKRTTSDDKIEFMINGVDEYVWDQGSPVNRYEDIVESIIKDLNLDSKELSNVYFTVLDYYDGKFERHSFESFVNPDSLFPEYYEDFSGIKI